MITPNKAATRIIRSKKRIQVFKVDNPYNFRKYLRTILNSAGYGPDAVRLATIDGTNEVVSRKADS